MPVRSRRLGTGHDNSAKSRFIMDGEAANALSIGAVPPRGYA